MLSKKQIKFCGPIGIGPPKDACYYIKTLNKAVYLILEQDKITEKP